MKKWHIAGIGLLVVGIAVLSYFVGYQTASDKISVASEEESQTFYASVSEIKEDTLWVKGLEINDINYRGEFTFPIKEETAFLWRGTPINPEDLEPSDTISITFRGEVLESYPAIIQNVTKVQLLEDEV